MQEKIVEYLREQVTASEHFDYIAEKTDNHVLAKVNKTQHWPKSCLEDYYLFFKLFLKSHQMTLIICHLRRRDSETNMRCCCCLTFSIIDG